MNKKGKRRADGEGTIWYEPETDRWRARISLNNPTGPRTKKLSAKTQEEILVKKAEAIYERDQGLIFDAEGLTVEEYLNRWIKGPAKKKVRASTYSRYEQCVRLHLIPAIGRLTLKKLTAVHLEALYEAKLEADLSPRSVNYIHTTMSKALKYAVGKDLLRRNVAAHADAPQPEKPEIQPLTAEQAGRFLSVVREEQDRLEALWVLALSTGMRRSELLGLKDTDLDLGDAGTLQIRRGLTVAPGGGVAIQKTKRNSSQRLLELSPETVAALRRHTRAIRPEERLAAGRDWDEQGFVFTGPTGGHMDPHRLYRPCFIALRDRAGVPPIHFHDLRHTYATLALLDGQPVKVVSETLGHKDIATTLRTYAHVLPGMGKEAAARMDSVLFGPR